VELFWTSLLIVASLAGTGVAGMLALRLRTESGR
jgi:hypothetical protein